MRNVSASSAAQAHRDDDESESESVRSPLSSPKATSPRLSQTPSGRVQSPRESAAGGEGGARADQVAVALPFHPPANTRPVAARRTVCVPSASLVKMNGANSVGAERLTQPAEGMMHDQPTTHNNRSRFARVVVGTKKEPDDAPDALDPAAVTIDVDQLKAGLSGRTSNGDDAKLASGRSRRDSRSDEKPREKPSRLSLVLGRRQEDGLTTIRNRSMRKRRRAARRRQLAPPSKSICCSAGPRTWMVLPWAVIGFVVLLAVLLTITLTNSISDSYPYLLWPWYGAFVVSVVWAMLFQEVFITLFLVCARRRAAARAARAAEEPPDRALSTFDENKVKLDKVGSVSDSL